MPTALGAIFFFAGLYCFCFAQEWLLSLLIIAAGFEASSAVNFADRGVQPYYIIAVLVSARGLMNRMMWAGEGQRRLFGVHWLLLFAVLAAGSAFICPILFAGTPVYDPKVHRCRAVCAATS